MEFTTEELELLTVLLIEIENMQKKQSISLGECAKYCTNRGLSINKSTVRTLLKQGFKYCENCGLRVPACLTTRFKKSVVCPDCLTADIVDAPKQLFWGTNWPDNYFTTD